jgi:putative phage-type endonuclease
MRIANNLPQNSKEWLAWRQSGLGASDAPIIMGVSPFTTRFELWLEKTGIGERPDFHPMAIKAMTRGTLLEPEARKYYENMVKASFEPMNVIHDKYDFIRASLDGYNKEHNRIVEIKCPGKEDLKEAAKGRIPKKYMPQVQLQLLVSGAVACDYFTYDGEKGTSIEVLPDLAYQQSLESEMIAFWKLVETKTPPSITFKNVVKSFQALSNAWGRMNKAHSALNSAIEVFGKQEKEERDK